MSGTIEVPQIVALCRNDEKQAVGWTMILPQTIKMIAYVPDHTGTSSEQANAYSSPDSTDRILTHTDVYVAKPAPGATQQVEQGTQRRHTDPAPRLGQRGGRGCGHRQPVQPGNHLRPHLPVPQLGEQPSGQQQVDHNPRGHIPRPRLDLAGLGNTASTISNDTTCVSSPR